MPTSWSKKSNEIIDRSIGNLKTYFEIGIVSFIVSSLYFAPEGCIREGDYLPVVFLFLLFLLGLALGILKVYKTRSSKEKSYSVGAPPSVVPTKLDRYLNRIADVSLGAFVLFATLSYAQVYFCHTGDVRLSTNAYWTFTIPALFYLTLRFFRTYLSERVVFGLLLLLISCAFAESVYSTYSYFVTTPQLKQAYLANPDQMLKENGLSFEKGSRERLLFEKRLLSSTEPTGTYGLANTLAGFLAPVFLLASLGIPWKTFFSQKFLFLHSSDRSQIDKIKLLSLFLWISGVLSVAFILLATKSRSGVLATILGMGCWGILEFIQLLRTRKVNSKRFLLILVGSAFLVLCSIIGAFAFGIIDREVFTEAGKSLGYRLDYWRATASMINDRPFLGIGPGEFQNVYAQYILPTASEFIADPHNFIFELAAIFGVPAFCMFAIFLTSTLVKGGVHCFNTKDVDEQEKTSSSAVPLTFIFGVSVALCFAFFCSFFQSAPLGFSFIILTLLINVVVFVCIRRLFPKEYKIPTTVVLATLIALLINLCAAGGIGYPVISTSLFLLAAILVNRDRFQTTDTIEARKINKPVRSKKAPIVFVLVITSVVVLFYITALKPAFNVFMFKLQNVPQSNVSNLYQADFETFHPEHIDVHSTYVAQQFYYYEALKFFKSQTNDNLELWQKATNLVKRTSPNSASVRENCGDFDVSLYKQSSSNDRLLKSAAQFYQEAVDLSPTDAFKHEKLFHVLKELGQDTDAQKHAEIALELDSQTPHEDRKLSDESRKELKRFVDR